MKRETVIVLRADDGMYLTNGEVYGKTVILGDWDKPENYYEVTEAEYEEILKAQSEIV